jgi:exopolysaccharide biosynthesis polyprenyl glycosylphosphotransferase
LRCWQWVGKVSTGKTVEPEHPGGYMTAINDRPIASTKLAQLSTNIPTWQRGYARKLVASDVVGVVFAVGLGQWLRFGSLPGISRAYHYWDYQYWNYTAVSVAIAGVWLLALSINRSRSPRVIGAGAEEYRRVGMATLSVFGGVAIISMLFKLDIARGYLAIALPTGIVFLVLFRWIARRMIARARLKHGRYVTRVLVVGNASAVKDLTKSFAREPKSGYEVVGACIPGPVIRTNIDIPGVGTIPTFGDESNVVGAVTATNSHAVAVTATERLDGRGIRDLSWELEKLNIDLLVAPGVVDVAGPRLLMRPVCGLPLIHVEKPQYNGAKRFQKRLFDIVFSSTVLLFGFPLLLAVAVAVKLNSKGPVFYRSERIGLNGQPFEMIKFRTMVDGADAMVNKLTAFNDSDGGVLFKIRADPRVTSVGRLLRKYSIDELPQFINVFKRDMSVVGPRPPLATEVKSYDDYAKRRLLVRPGITGLWQVSGRSDLSWEDSVRLDMFYVENWSMVADLLIAVKTLKAVFGHSGAY